MPWTENDFLDSNSSGGGWTAEDFIEKPKLPPIKSRTTRVTPSQVMPSTRKVVTQKLKDIKSKRTEFDSAKFKQNLKNENLSAIQPTEKPISVDFKQPEQSIEQWIPSRMDKVKSILGSVNKAVKALPNSVGKFINRVNQNVGHDANMGDAPEPKNLTDTQNKIANTAADFIGQGINMAPYGGEIDIAAKLAFDLGTKVLGRKVMASIAPKIAETVAKAGSKVGSYEISKVTPDAVSNVGTYLTSAAAHGSNFIGGIEVGKQLSGKELNPLDIAKNYVEGAPIGIGFKLGSDILFKSIPLALKTVRLKKEAGNVLDDFVNRFKSEGRDQYVKTKSINDPNAQAGFYDSMISRAKEMSDLIDTQHFIGQGTKVKNVKQMLQTFSENMKVERDALFENKPSEMKQPGKVEQLSITEPQAITGANVGQAALPEANRFTNVSPMVTIKKYGEVEVLGSYPHKKYGEVISFKDGKGVKRISPRVDFENAMVTTPSEVGQDGSNVSRFGTRPTENTNMSPQTSQTVIESLQNKVMDNKGNEITPPSPEVMTILEHVHQSGLSIDNYESDIQAQMKALSGKKSRRYKELKQTLDLVQEAKDYVNIHGDKGQTEIAPMESASPQPKVNSVENDLKGIAEIVKSGENIDKLITDAKAELKTVGSTKSDKYKVLQDRIWLLEKAKSQMGEMLPSQRTLENVADRKINPLSANADLQPHLKDEAMNLLTILDNGTKGEKFYAKNTEGQINITGTSRDMGIIADIRDYTGASYDSIEKALNVIIEGKVKNHHVLAKKIEVFLDDRLSKGYKDTFWSGQDIPANGEYMKVRGKIEGVEAEPELKTEVVQKELSSEEVMAAKDYWTAKEGQMVSQGEIDNLIGSPLKYEKPSKEVKVSEYQKKNPDNNRGITEKDGRNQSGGDGKGTIGGVGSNKPGGTKGVEAPGGTETTKPERKVRPEKIVEPKGIFQKQIVEMMDSLGVKVEFYKDDPKIPHDGFYEGGNTLYIKDTSNDLNAVMATVGHEFFHSVRENHPELFEDLLEFGKEHFTHDEKMQFLDTYSEVPEEQDRLAGDEDKLVEEMLADELGNNFVKKDFWTKLYEYSKDLFDKLVKVANDLVNKISGHKYETFVAKNTAAELTKKFEDMISIIRNEVKNDPKGTNAEVNLSVRKKVVGENLDSTRQPQEQNLVALHNISSEKLLKAIELGGIPVPSIAVTKDDIPFTSFGEITLVGSKGMIDPQTDSTNKVFNTDVYSRRMPTQQEEVKNKVMWEIMDKFRQSYEDAGSYHYNIQQHIENGNLGDAVKRISEYPGTKLQYLRDIGQDIKIPMREKALTIDYTPEMKATIKTFIKDNPNFMDYDYEDNGHGDEIAAMADKLVKSIVMQNIEGLYPELSAKDKTALSWGYLRNFSYTKGKISYEEFKTFDPLTDSTINHHGIDKIRSDIHNITNPEKVIDQKALREKIDSKFKSPKANLDYKKWLRETLDPAFGKKYFKDNGRKYDWNINTIFDYMAGRIKGEENFHTGPGTAKAMGAKKFNSISEMHKNDSTLKTDAEVNEFKNEFSTVNDPVVRNISKYNKYPNGFDVFDDYYKAMGDYLAGKTSAAGALSRHDFIRVPASLVEEFKQASDMLKNAPVSYFEAKPQRVVRFKDFKAALVPKGTDKAIIQKLKDVGIGKIIEFQNTPKEKKSIVGGIEVFDSEPFNRDDAWLEALGKTKKIPDTRFSVRRKETQHRYKMREDAKVEINELSHNWKDKAIFRFNNDFAVRNFEKTMGKDAPAMINKYLTPLFKDVADGVRLKGKIFKEVDALGIKTTLKDIKVLQRTAEKVTGSLRRFDESALVQIYGEGELVEAVNYIDPNTGKKGKTIAKNPYTLADLTRDVPNAKRRDKIIKAAEYGRKTYDDLLDMLNEARTRNGYPPVPKIKNYFLHMRVIGDILENFKDEVSINDLPTEINGITVDFRPGKTFFNSADMHRLGQLTEYDFVNGIKKYISGAVNQIYTIDDVTRLRSLEDALRGKYSDENLKGLRDKLAENNMFEDEKPAIEKDIETLRSLGTKHLTNFTAWLGGYIGDIAGKKAFVDRGIEAMAGRSAYTLLDAFTRQVGRNMVGANLGSALTQFIPLASSVAETSKVHFLKGMVQTALNIFKDDGLMDKSDFLTSRLHDPALLQSIMDYASQAAYSPMKVVDWLSANMVVRGKYNELKAQGMSDDEAIKKADDFARKLMAGRSKGEMPTLHSSKLLKIFTQFQLEVNNQYQHMFGDVWKYNYSEDKKKGFTKEFAKENPKAYNLAMASFKFAQIILFTYLMNVAYKNITGRKPAFDIADITMKFVDNMSNHSSEQAGRVLFDDITKNTPYIGSFLGGGRIPIQAAIPDAAGVVKGTANAKKETTKLGYLLFPMGFGQVKKVKEGTEVFNHEIPGNYGTNSSGEEYLKYPVEDTAANKIKTSVFGPYATKESQPYFDNRTPALTVKETKALEATKSQGKDEMELYGVLIESKQLKARLSSLQNRIKRISLSDKSEETKAEEIASAKSKIDALVEDYKNNKK